jgi:hypothetical protein
MCAPRKALIPLLIAGGLAVATGGISFGASTATTAATTGATTAASTAATAAQSFEYLNFATGTASQSTTLSSLSSALKVGLKYANQASPFIGSYGLIYSGQLQKGIYEQQAAFSKYQAVQEEETYQLRKDQRRRQLAIALGKQRALYGISGVALDETPTDILEQTSRNFAFDDYVDKYSTASKMTSLGLSASNLRASGRQAEIGGLLNAELTLSRRGLV